MADLPTLQVLLDDGTGTFPHDITDRVRMVGGWNFNRGRSDQLSGVTAGVLNLSLDNADGGVSPGSTTIDTPSPIVVDQRIRVKETVNGTTFTRYTGYVKSWRVGWPGGGQEFSVVQVTATDAQARAERRILRSVVEEEILLDGPLVHYPLGEPEGATSAADHSGNQAPALTMIGGGADVVFGNATGPGTDGLTAAEFAGGKYLKSGASVSAGVVECFFSRTGNPSVAEALIASTGPAFGGIAIDTDGTITTTGSDLGSSPVVTDGGVHHLSWQSGHVLVDGVDIGSPTKVPEAGALLVGGPGDYLLGGGTAVTTLTGSISHVVVYATLSTTRAADHSDAGLTGFAGESGTDRITRIAGWAGIPVGTLDTSLTNVSHKDITGASAWSAIAEVTEAEGGLSYVDGSGDLIFLNRNTAPEKVTPDLTIAAEFVHFDAAPTDDDAEILNYVETTAEGTQVAQVVTDAASETAHGRYSDSKTYLVETDAEALARANWLVGNYAEPTTRFGTLTINLFGMSAAQQEAAIAALAPGAWLRVTDMPSQTQGGTTVDVMVQGFAEEQSASSWSLTCNVVARSLFEAWILGDSTFGVLDSTTRLYV